MSNDQLFAVSNQWLDQISRASASGDVHAFVDLFLEDGWLRDFLCYSWDLRTLRGREKIAAFLSENVDGQTRLQRSGLHDFKLNTTSTIRSPSYFDFPGKPDVKAVEASFTFSVGNPQGRGQGYFRIVQVSENDWKAFTVFTDLHDLEGHEEPKERPYGHYDHHMTTWPEFRAKRGAEVEKDPTVLIVGGGHAGLMAAARMQNRGLRVLVIEKGARIGDSWRERYPNLTIHTPARFSSLLYQEWPMNFPEFIAKDRLADFVEMYAISQDLHIWLSSAVLPTITYDSTLKRWTVHVDHAGEKVTLHPRHVVMATGSGQPNIPEWPGMRDFKGPICHSDNFRNAAQFEGKRVVVVGAANAAGDVCIDLVSKGAKEVTMVQRNATCLTTLKTAQKLFFRDDYYAEGKSIEDADLAHISFPSVLAMELSAKGGTAMAKKMDEELLAGLRKAGFRLTWQIDPQGEEVGLAGFVFQRLASGSMLDVGCGQLIVDGKVKVKTGVDIERFASDAVVFKDGTSIPADAVVLATGNRPVIEVLRALLGDSVADKLGDRIFAIDEEGELSQCFRPTGVPGLWLANGGFQQTRIYSKPLALQILAEELQLKPSP